MRSEVNYAAVLRAAQGEQYCDVGHCYCPRLREDGALLFPSGIVYPDGRFSGARRLHSLLSGEPPRSVNLFLDGHEESGHYHYPSGTHCEISTLPEGD